MGLSMTHKIIKAHTSMTEWKTGDNVVINVDKTFFHDATGKMVITIMKAANNLKLASPENHFVVMDHAVPASSVTLAAFQKDVREFIQKYGEGKVNYYEVGAGIGHQVVVESRKIKPGEILVGADSHTCTAGALNCYAFGMGATDVAAATMTRQSWIEVPRVIYVHLTGELPPYCSGKDVILTVIGKLGCDGGTYGVFEYGGPGVKSLSMDDRFTISNMAVEGGASSGLFPVDDVTREYYQDPDLVGVDPDPDADYDVRLDINLSELTPVVAAPHRPDNVHKISDLEPVKVHQAFIGSCTNGRLSDLRVAAQILKGKKIAEHTRMIVIAASREIQKQAMKEGLFDIFVEAGAMINHSNCGPCLGMHEGLLAPDEVCISAANRNFVGRMGSTKASIYLGSPATVAASALRGQLTDPREVLTW